MQKSAPIYSYALYSLAALILSLGSGCAYRENHDVSQQLVYLQQDPQHPGQQRIQIMGKEFIVLADVLQPGPDSLHLLRHTHIRPDESVLDMGTGTGVKAVFAASQASHVVATDINPAAGHNARLNIQLYGLSDKIEVRIGDLFAPIQPQERFDVVLFNIEYPNSNADLAMWNVHERFFAQVREHLNPDGRIYYQTGYRRNLPKIYAMLKENGLQASAEYAAPAVLDGEQYITLVIHALH